MFIEYQLLHNQMRASKIEKPSYITLKSTGSDENPSSIGIYALPTPPATPSKKGTNSFQLCLHNKTVTVNLSLEKYLIGNTE